MKTFVLMLLLIAAPCAAQEPTPSWDAHRSIADAFSTAAVATSIGLDTWHTWRAPDRAHALTQEALRMGVSVGAAELVKRLIHRPRPDASDDRSFYSEHTALAAAASGWRLQVTLPLIFGTGYGRMAAAKHHPSDVVVGALAGGLAARFIR